MISKGKASRYQLPQSVMEIKGTWNATTNTPILTDSGSHELGDVYIVSVAGTQFTPNITFAIGDSLVYDTNNKWVKISNKNVYSKTQLDALNRLDTTRFKTSFYGSRSYPSDNLWTNQPTNTIVGIAGNLVRAAQPIGGIEDKAYNIISYLETVENGFITVYPYDTSVVWCNIYKITGISAPPNANNYLEYSVEPISVTHSYTTGENFLVNVNRSAQDGGIKNNYAATTDPSTGNDNTENYSIGSRWINTSNSRVWTCVDASTGAALWSTDIETINNDDGLLVINNTDNLNPRINVSGKTGTSYDFVLRDNPTINGPNIGGVMGYQASKTSGGSYSINGQGGYTGWSLYANGRTIWGNQQGLGAGGWEWVGYNNSNAQTLPAQGQAMILDQSGNLACAGSINASAKNFKIDHPLFPDTKHLYHCSIESNRRLNIYRDNVILDANGESTVQLPEYFNALNENINYNLTCIGQHANIYISQEVDENNQFKIAGGVDGQKISWDISGERKDKYALDHPFIEEVDKE